MKKLLSRLIWVPVGLALVFFLLANRRLVAVSLDPFNVENPTLATPALPFWVWLMTMLLIGFFLGSATMWMSEGGKRRQMRAQRRELQDIKKEQSRAEAAAATGDNLPVLKAS